MTPEELKERRERLDNLKLRKRFDDCGGGPYEVLLSEDDLDWLITELEASWQREEAALLTEVTEDVLEELSWSAAERVVKLIEANRGGDWSPTELIRDAIRVEMRKNYALRQQLEAARADSDGRKADD